MPSAGLAQTSTEVVQPLPPVGVSDLNDALRRLASNSRNVSALLDAGDAALKLGDTDAAIGFFGRADELAPGNARVKMGLASAYVRRESPLEALRLFDEAERAGVSSAALAGDRGLAYDLVGDSARAQQFYYQALSLRRDDEVTRRLALSQAISGDRKSFEATLLPLLNRQDFGAFRIRSFGLAILGDDKEAIEIAEAVMPSNLSRRIKPYLRYMDRLTPSQQAAAAHFGNFPLTAQIGQDDPRIASYTPSERPGRTARAADRSLTPQGEPLGPKEDVAAVQEPNVTKGRSEIKVTTLPQVAVAELPPAINKPFVPQSASSPVAAAESALQTAVQLQQAARPTLEVATSETVAVVEPVADVVAQLPAQPATEPMPETAAKAVVVDSIAAPSAPAPLIPAAQSTPVVQAVAVPTPQPAEPASVADAFADFSLAPGPVRPAASGGVDITSIKPPVEAAKKPAAEPAKPAKQTDPSRFWVQVATGKDRSALRFDWRRMSGKASNLLGKRKGYLASWNQTNRLITGPFDSLKEARAFVSELEKAGIGSFTFTSADGEKVDPLP